MTNNFRLVATITAACLLMAGCATETRTEREFGDSVRAVATAQIHDMGAAQYPSKDPVTGGPGDRLENVVKTHKVSAGRAAGAQNAGSMGAVGGAGAVSSVLVGR